MIHNSYLCWLFVIS